MDRVPVIALALAPLTACCLLLGLLVVVVGISEEYLAGSQQWRTRS